MKRNSLMLLIVLLIANAKVDAQVPYGNMDGEELRFAQEKFDVESNDKWKLAFSGLADLRFAQTSDERAFQDPDSSSFGGRGNLRYGGRDKSGDGVGDRNGLGFHLSHLDFIAEVARNKNKVGHIHLLFDDTANQSSSGTKVGVFEAFLRNEYQLAKNLKLELKAGLFLPKISLENRDVAWSSSYSITPSAINSWIGEEIKVKGLQASMRTIQWNTLLEATGGIFSGNDGMGSVLSWRGWTMHDNYSFYGKTLRLRQQTLITAGTVDPFIELDNKIGYYGRLELWWNKLIRINYFYLNNNGDRNIRDQVTRNWAWETKFHHLGLQIGPYSGYELLAQAMQGSGQAGRTPEVTNDYESAYIMLAKKWQKLGISLRYDLFRVIDKDDTSDKNYQNGHAKTIAANYFINQRQLLMLETIVNESERRGNESYADFNKHKSSIYQLSYRLIY